MSSHYDRSDCNDKLICNFHSIGKTLHHMSEGRGSQQRILTILRETGSISQSELTQRLGVQPGSASEVIGKLESAGLILRTLSPSDRRTQNITLTPEGQIQADEAFALREQRHRAMFSCLSEEEKETLLSLLERINEDWAARYPRRNAR